MNGVQHATKPPRIARGFARRAAIAWIRAADAGLIDAGELNWLLAHLPSDLPLSTQAATEIDRDTVR